MEEGFTMIARGIMFGVDIIVIDSVAGMVPAAELEKKPGDVAKIGGIAKPMGENLPKFAGWLMKYPKDPETKETSKTEQGTALIFINQTRSVIGGQSNDPENTPGGKALKFFSYVRLRTSRLWSESVEKTDPFTGKKKKFPYGNHTKVKCVMT
jgi:recombination protein RecA